MWRMRFPKAGADHLREALAIMEKLDTKGPEARHLLARTYHELGMALPGPEGHEGRRRSVEIMEALAKDFPQVPDYRAELAEGLLAMPPRPLLAGGPWATEKRLRRAVDLANELTRAYPEAPECRALLARARQRLGANLAGQGRSEEGVKEMRQALTLFREIEGRVAPGPGSRFGMIETRVNLAEALRQKGELSEARSLLEASVPELERITRLLPRNRIVRNLLAKGYRALAQVYGKLGDTQKAAAYARKADEVKGPP
jgi:tetratricopeptide (TPR) repeat protein